MTYYLMLLIALYIVVILTMINMRINELPKWEIKGDKTLTDYDKLIQANRTIKELKSKIKKLKTTLDIKDMNNALEKWEI